MEKMHLVKKVEYGYVVYDGVCDHDFSYENELDVALFRSLEAAIVFCERRFLDDLGELPEAEREMLGDDTPRWHAIESTGDLEYVAESDVSTETEIGLGYRICQVEVLG